MSHQAALIIAQFNFSAFVAGMIWYLQFVHFPSYRDGLGPQADIYIRQQGTRIKWALGLFMAVELLISILLLVYLPLQVPIRWTTTNLALVLATWASTIFVQLPLHARLERKYDEPTHRLLIRTHWIRTVTLALRIALLNWVMLQEFTFRAL